jgi:hypothetical protein
LVALTFAPSEWLKVEVSAALKAAGHDVVDFSAHALVVGGDYPDFVVP